MDGFNFHGKRMNATETDPNGVINSETIFEFQQQGDMVTASYSGGLVKQGFLIGKVENGKFNFQYTQMDLSAKLDGGKSVCDLELTADGHIRIIEHFDWSSRESSGVNIIEEIADQG